MESDKISSLASLRPGDLMFTDIGGLVPGLFPVKIGQLLTGDRVRLGKISVDHVGVVVEAVGASLEYFSGPSPARLVQAMPRGAEEIELTPADHWNDRTAYLRLPEDYPGQGSDAAAIARAMIGTPYSFASYLALAAWRAGAKTPRLEKWINRRRDSEDLRGDPLDRQIELPCEAICSVLADQAWTLAGKRVMRGTAPQVVTPGRLWLQLRDRDGVIIGGKGILR